MNRAKFLKAVPEVRAALADAYEFIESPDVRAAGERIIEKLDAMQSQIEAESRTPEEIISGLQAAMNQASAVLGQAGKPTAPGQAKPAAQPTKPTIAQMGVF